MRHYFLFLFLFFFSQLRSFHRRGEGESKILYQVMKRRETVWCFWKSASRMRGHVARLRGPLFVVGNRQPPNNGDTVVDSVISLSFNRDRSVFQPRRGISAIFSDRPCRAGERHNTRRSLLNSARFPRRGQCLAKPCLHYCCRSSPIAHRFHRSRVRAYVHTCEPGPESERPSLTKSLLNKSCGNVPKSVALFKLSILQYLFIYVKTYWKI